MLCRPARRAGSRADDCTASRSRSCSRLPAGNCHPSSSRCCQHLVPRLAIASHSPRFNCFGGQRWAAESERVGALLSSRASGWEGCCSEGPLPFVHMLLCAPTTRRRHSHDPWVPPLLQRCQIDDGRRRMPVAPRHAHSSCTPRMHACIYAYALPPCHAWGSHAPPCGTHAHGRPRHSPNGTSLIMRFSTEASNALRSTTAS